MKRWMVLGLAAISANVFGATHMHCEAGTTEITVDVDVLKSNPPQSRIEVSVDGQRRSGFTSVTTYRLVETNPATHSWQFRAGTNGAFLRVTTQEPSGRGDGKGTYVSGRGAQPVELDCHIH